jgi:serine/threonine protein kinase
MLACPNCKALLDPGAFAGGRTQRSPCCDHPLQACQVCGALNDVGTRRDGEKLPCRGRSCGVPLTVRRSDQVVVAAGSRLAEAARPEVAPLRRPAPGPEVAPQPPRPARAGEAQEVKTDQGAIPLEIPGYELHEIIGKGGMGRVYRATQRSLQREVAIKVLNEDLARHKSFIRRFEKEAFSLAALQHPHIATIHDTSHVGPHYFLVMEYIGGQSLRHKLGQHNQGRIPLERIAGLFSSLCLAVEHAHKNRVIHRDLKPENVLFTREDVLKVVDFGLANILDGQGRWELTRTKVSMGTVNYMAPEQRKDAKHVDHRADIYSLGVMLYEFLTGELPLGRFEDPSRRRAGVPPELDRLVARMLEFEPEKRPQAAGLVAHTLERLLGQGASPVAPVLIRPEPPARLLEAPSTPRPEEPLGQPRGQRPGPRPGRRRRMWGALAFLLGGSALLGVGAVAFFLLFLHRGLSETLGDVRLRQENGAVSLELIHPHEVKHVPPRERGARQGRLVTRFDFKTSGLASLPVKCLGGDWLAEDGRLTQDTSRRELTINQVPARALLGAESLGPEGLDLRANIRLEASTWSQGEGAARPVPMQQVVERLPDVQARLPAAFAPSVGLGVLDESGARGLLLLIPLAPGTQGRLLRQGEGLEGGDETFSLPAGLSPERTSRLSLAVKDGRLRFELDGQPLLDGLAGFPPGFRGLPAVACQNARCSFLEIEYSTPAGVR